MQYYNRLPVVMEHISINVSLLGIAFTTTMHQETTLANMCCNQTYQNVLTTLLCIHNAQC